MGQWTGGTPELEEQGDQVEDGLLVLPPELEPSVTAFTVAATQWRWVTSGFAIPMGGMMLRPLRVGLDYPGVVTAWKLAGIESTPALFEDLRFMEAEALKALGEAAADD